MVIVHLFEQLRDANGRRAQLPRRRVVRRKLYRGDRRASCGAAAATVAQHPQLHNAGGTRQRHEEYAEDRGQEQRHAEWQVSVEAEECHVDALTVLQHEDQEEEEYGGEGDGGHPQATGSRPRHRPSGLLRPAAAGIADFVVVRRRVLSMIFRGGHDELASPDSAFRCVLKAIVEHVPEPVTRWGAPWDIGVVSALRRR